MRFGEHFLEDLKARIRPSEVIGKHVRLKRQGREFVAFSPFTNEKTPSFFVNDEKGFYHCFSSGKHGDAISFLMEVEGLSFPEAVARLAAMAGMNLPRADPDMEKRADADKQTIHWITQAQGFFERALRTDSGREARTYLKSRGLTGEDCRHFGIGYAPDSFDALRGALTHQGAKIEELVEAGLLVAPDDKNKKPWDRFRNRIMFPITDTRGRPVAFGGRALSPDEKAKYLNSPETRVFHKGRLLYRYPEARKALHTPGNSARGLIVAEGYMDVIALAKAGFEHACAPLGTALTEDQIKLLWRAGPEPVLCFDGDAAGLRAAYRSVERALPLLRPGQTLRFAILPDGQDPDDLIRAKGAGIMQAVLEKPVLLVEMLWRREAGALPLESPEAKAGLKSRIFKALNDIKNTNVREQYTTALLTRFDQIFGRPERRFIPGKTKQKAPKDQKARMNANHLRIARERRLMGAVLEWPGMLESIDQTLFGLQFSHKACTKLQTILFAYWQDTTGIDKRALHGHIEDQGLAADLAQFKREHMLTVAAFGGSTVDEKLRIHLWLEEARALQGRENIGEARQEKRGRMADIIRAENADGLKRLMRVARQSRK